MFIYALLPIDFWAAWSTESEYKGRLQKEHDPGRFLAAWVRYLNWRTKALEKAKHLGWEGDFRDGPYVSGLPPLDGNPESEVLIGWKQSNNGTCFIASPLPLAWLDELGPRRERR